VGGEKEFHIPIISCLFFLRDYGEVIEVLFSAFVLLMAVKPSSAATVTLFQFFKVLGSVDD
jgi:hypothetical protein